MKSDINLLQKQKSQKYSGQKVVMIILVLILFSGAAYAGITIPNNIRQTAQMTVAKLSSEIESANSEAENLVQLNKELALRKEQLDALTVIDAAKSDLDKYLDAIERSKPSNTVFITYLEATEITISITGMAASTEDLAAFCLHLRQTEEFEDVFVAEVAYVDEVLAFSMQITLPVSLDSSAVLPEPEETPTPTKEAEQ